MSLVDYTIASWLIRISVLLLYLRLFPDEKFRHVVKVLLILFGMMCVVFTVYFARQLWYPDSQNKASLLVQMHWAQTYLVIFADLTVVILPLPTIWKLNLALEKRISIMAMFSVGLL